MSDEQEKKELPKLSRKLAAFVDEYFICGMNATEAYMRLHPRSKYNSARSSAWEILTNPDVKAHVDARMTHKTMQADEALARLSDIARGDLGDFINDFGGVDLATAREKGLTKLLKRVRTQTITINGNRKSEDKEIITEDIEPYPADSALEKILKIYGKLKGDQPIVNNYIKGYKSVSPDDWKDNDSNG